MFKRVAIATIAGTLAGIILGTAAVFIAIELDDGKRWDFTWS